MAAIHWCIYMTDHGHHKFSINGRCLGCGRKEEK